MNDWTSRQMRDRGDRHVRRARLSLGAGAPAYRCAFTVEEALRLASLPGENEGRSYYFRHLRITGLPADGARGIWLERFQRTLNDQASQAVHGADPRAEFAGAVFFHGEPEALEVLLHRVLAHHPVREWFWPMVTAAADVGTPGNFGGVLASNSEAILGILEELRARPASWIVVAAAVFSVPDFDVAALLNAIPASVAQSWVREMEGSRPLPAYAVAAIPQHARPAIDHAVRNFGDQYPGTLWLAVLAVLLESPSELAAGTAVSRARIALQEPHFVTGAGEPWAEFGNAAESAAPKPLSAAEKNARPTERSIETSSKPVEPTMAGDPIKPMSAAPAAPIHSAVPTSVANLASVPTQVSGAGPSAHTASPRSSREPASAASLPRATEIALTRVPGPGDSKSTSVSLPWRCSGLPTTAAGLFFLLNALQQIGIAQALASGLAEPIPNFAPYVLQRLAEQAGVSAEDPILLWLNSLLPTSQDEVRLPCEASWLPSNLRFSPASVTREELIRIWSVAVRRWCWRTAKVRMQDVVLRAGLFSVNRTDLDVSLRIDKADIRVRLAGLDLDPGWLPWFGRVVRFHYVFPGAMRG